MSRRGRDHHCRLSRETGQAVILGPRAAPAMACISAMQKAIRRGMEREAMEFAVELMHTSKAFHRMSATGWKSFAMKTSTRWPRHASSPSSPHRSRHRGSDTAKSIGEARLMIGNCIRLMCRPPKSRAGCHFAAAIGLRSMLEDFAPEIPDCALDMHTMKGKTMAWSRSFRREGAKLVPEPTEPDCTRGRVSALAIKTQGK